VCESGWHQRSHRRQRQPSLNLPLYVRDVQATLADGTEYLFPASEFSFISPRVAKPASPVTARLPAIVHVIPFAVGSWTNTHKGYTYRETLGDLYVYGVTAPDLGMVYDLQYNRKGCHFFLILVFFLLIFFPLYIKISL
jgi:hypothetical protein